MQLLRLAFLANTDSFLTSTHNKTGKILSKGTRSLPTSSEGLSVLLHKQAKSSHLVQKVVLANHLLSWTTRPDSTGINYQS
jgi:hypothetical protein